MTITAKALADGQLPTTKGALYTAPANTMTYVKSIVAHNTNAADQIVVLSVNRSGTSRVIARAVLGQNETLYYNAPLTLEADDAIEGVTTTASAVDYTISGAEES
jgi:hypothetical protein